MWPLGSCYSWSVHRKFRTHRTLFTGACLWLALQGRSGAAHETQQLQNQPPPSHEMPARQLQYATRIPPSQWELQGVVEARDLERLLLRRTVPGKTREPLKPVLIGGSIDYTTEDFQNLAASDLIKMEVAGSSVPSTRDSPALPTGRKGRSFITNGPYLTLRVNGKEPGEELQLSDGSSVPIRVTVEAEVASIVPVDRLEIIVNGLLVKSKPIQGGGRQARITEELVLEKSSWIAARALGPGHRLIMNDPKAFAHTGPVFCYLNDQPIRSPHDARFWITWIDELIEDVEQRGTFATDQRRDSVIELFRKAQTVWADLAR